jgi:hypothetical protein
MTDANMPKPPPPNEELRWYYQDSASEVGFHGQVISDSGLGAEDPEPTERQIAKARDQARYKRALAKLTPAEQSVLEACYEPRQVDADMAMYGIGAGAVARAVQCCRDAADQADRIRLRAAQSCIIAEDRHERARRAATVAGEAHGLASRAARSAAAEAVRAWGASLAATKRAKAAERAWEAAKAKTGKRPVDVMLLVCRAHERYTAKRREQKSEDFEAARAAAEAGRERSRILLAELRERKPRPSWGAHFIAEALRELGLG